MLRKAVFLDRDGTIIENTGAHTADPDIEPLPGAADALRKLQDAGFVLTVVTNQAGVARGWYTEDQLRIAHESLRGKFAANGVQIAAIYHCPHHPTEGTIPEYSVACDCRKPAAGLIARAAADLGVDLAASYVIGDAERDVEAAVAAGCRGAALITPEGGSAFDTSFSPTTPLLGVGGYLAAAEDTLADAVVPDLAAAVDWVLDTEREMAGRILRIPKPARKPIRLAVLLSGGGTTLENLFARRDQGRLDATVAVVIGSRPDAFGLVRAQSRDVPTAVVERREFDSTAAFSEAINRELDRHEVDLVCLAGFMVLWEMPDRYLGRVMNIHPALIPAFCGRGFYGHFVHEAVVESGVKVTGCTVHFADREYDRGPIVVQRTAPVLDDDTPETVAARVFEQECEAYPEAIQLFAEGRLTLNGRRVIVNQPELDDMDLVNDAGLAGEQDESDG
jgi:formyltetrahydrofolate-dependent phosphoribosylglycinamide formyltransferase